MGVVVFFVFDVLLLMIGSIFIVDGGWMFE